MSMTKKHAVRLFLTLFLTAAAADCVFAESFRGVAQRVNAREKEEELMIPESELRPKVGRTYFEKSLRDFVMTLNRRVPQSLEGFKNGNKESFSTITPTYFKAHMNILNRIVNHPDLEEVTGNRRDWYLDMYALLEQVAQPVQDLQNAVRKNDADAYAEACARYDIQMNNVSKRYNDKPERLSGKEYNAVQKENRERRKQEYLEKMRKQQDSTYYQNDPQRPNNQRRR